MTKSLIITCTNLGYSHSANSAIYDILDDGLATSASLMVPSPWSREAAQNPRLKNELKNVSIGVQLTLNSECQNYRWGPITQSASLLDGNGGFPQTQADLFEHADPAEVQRECRSQIERASLWGFEISHLGSHLNALLPRPEYFDIYLNLAKEFSLPLRLNEEIDYGFPAKELADEAGVKYPDQIIELDLDTTAEDVSKMVASSNSQLIEILCAPMNDTPEAEAICSYETGIVVRKKLEGLKDLNVSLTNWSELFAKN